MNNQGIEKKVDIIFEDLSSIIPKYKCEGAYNLFSGNINLDIIPFSSAFPSYNVNGVLNLLSGTVDITVDSAAFLGANCKLIGSLNNKTGQFKLESTLADIIKYEIDGNFDMQKWKVDAALKGNTILSPDYKIKGGILNLQQGKVDITAKSGKQLLPSYTLKGIFNLSSGDVDLCFEVEHLLFCGNYILKGKLS